MDTFTNSQWIHLPTRKYTKYSVDKYSHCWVDEINRAVEFAPTPVRVLLLNRAGRIDFQGTVRTHVSLNGDLADSRVILLLLGHMYTLMGIWQTPEISYYS